MSFEVAVARPLAGRVILVTRAREQAAAFAALLEEAGGTVMLVTHDPEVGARAHRRVRMVDGAVVSDERP